MSLKQWFRNWLDLDRYQEQTTELLLDLAEDIGALERKAHTHEDVPDDDVPDDGNIAEWQDKPIEEWPTHINGQKVGYVLVEAGTLIEAPDKNNVLLPYENADLRGGDGTRALRLKAETDKWVMVYAGGTIYGAGSRTVRPFAFDGGNLAYLVMHEQRIDGINLWEHGLPPVYVRAANMKEIYDPMAI